MLIYRRWGERRANDNDSKRELTAKMNYTTTQTPQIKHLSGQKDNISKSHYKSRREISD
jgi:hypothetical protein